MEGGWLMGFADVVQDLGDGGVSVMAAPGILPPAAFVHPCTSKAMMRIVAPQTGQASGKVSYDCRDARLHGCRS
jgi:hypothetical protein